MATRRYRGHERGADGGGIGRDVTPLVRQSGRGSKRRPIVNMGMGCIFTNARFQSGNLRESGKAERVGNGRGTVRVLGRSGERV